MIKNRHGLLKKAIKSDKILREIQDQLNDLKEAKRKHIDSPQCERKAIGGCTACHYWSGAIHLLADLLDEPL